MFKPKKLNVKLKEVHGSKFRKDELFKKIKNRI